MLLLFEAPEASRFLHGHFDVVKIADARHDVTIVDMADDILLAARVFVLRDLRACGLDAAPVVNVVDDVIGRRRWWVEQWPDGRAFVAGQIAQDVQDRLLDEGLGRWPRCTACDDTDLHELHIQPDLGPDPEWVCEKSGIRVAPLGELQQ